MWNKCKSIIFSILYIIYFTFILQAAEITPQEVIAKMRGQEATLEDLQFSLRQVITLKELKEKQTLSARVIYKKPDSLYVEYKAPYEQLVIANHGEMALYIKDRGQWQENSRQKISELMGHQWKGNYGLWTSSDIEKNYNLKVSSGKNDQVLLFLKPKEKTYDFTLTIYLNKNNWLPSKTIWEDENQNIVTDLENMKINTKVKDDVFTFK